MKQSLTDAHWSCSNDANIGKRKTWTQSEFCRWQNSVRGQVPQKCIYSIPAQETAKHRAKFGWPHIERRWCSNEAKTRNPLKFTGVYRTRQQVSAVKGPTFTILRGHEILPFHTFFQIDEKCLTCTCEDITRQSCAMVRRWRFWRIFCVPYFQRAACSTFQTRTFQTCVLNSHQG